jgi:beta-glucanase (GH16 family)
VQRTAPIHPPAAVAATPAVIALAPLAAAALAGCELALIPAPERGADSNWNLAGWRLAWSDEFAAGPLSSAWTPETGDGSWGWGNNEQEYYTGRPENLAVVGDGTASVLRLRVRREDSAGFSYTSARLKTQGAFSFRYGRLEARIKPPRGQGLRPAFWLLGEYFGAVGWPACGEIDVPELKGGISDDTVGGAMHWGPDAARRSSVDGSFQLAAGVFADGYHLFGLEWDASTVAWFVDGQRFMQATVAEADRAASRSGGFFIILNLAVGGNYVAGQTPAAGFVQQDLPVDWVRLWAKK